MSFEQALKTIQQQTKTYEAQLLEKLVEDRYCQRLVDAKSIIDQEALAKQNLVKIKQVLNFEEQLSTLEEKLSNLQSHINAKHIELETMKRRVEAQRILEPKAIKQIRSIITNIRLDLENLGDGNDGHWSERIEDRLENLSELLDTC